MQRFCYTFLNLNNSIMARPRIKSNTIFEKPLKYRFQNCPRFWWLAKKWLSYCQKTQGRSKSKLTYISCAAMEPKIWKNKNLVFPSFKSEFLLIKTHLGSQNWWRECGVNLNVNQKFFFSQNLLKISILVKKLYK